MESLSELISQRQRQVLQNPLILRKIVSNLKLPEPLPLRQVCPLWKETVDFELPRRLPFKIVPGHEGWIEKMIDGLKYLKSLRLTTLVFWWGKENQKFIIAFHLKDFFSQIETLEINFLNLENEADFIALETFLTSMPNLRKLKLELQNVNKELLLKYKGRFLHQVKISSAKDEDYENGGEIVQKVLEMFPNLERNFDDSSLDIPLFKLRMGETFLPLMKISLEYSFHNLSKVLQALSKLDQKMLPNLRQFKISICSVMEKNWNCVEKFLSNFPLLEKIKIFTSHPFGNAEAEGIVCLTVPPLRKLKELVVMLPPIKNGKPVCLLNFGQQLAKDFPSLEKLIFEYRYQYERSEFKYDYPESWGIWEPFLSISGQGSSDLSPLKAIRHVDFKLPTHWFEQKKNLSWAKSVLQVYNKLYARVGKQFCEDMENLKRFCDEEMFE